MCRDVFYNSLYRWWDLGFLEGNSIPKEKQLLTVTAPICFRFLFFGQEIVFAHVYIYCSLKPLTIILCSTWYHYGKKVSLVLLGPGYWGMSTWSNQQLQVQTLCAPHYLFCLLLQIILSRVVEVAEKSVSFYFFVIESSFILAQHHSCGWFGERIEAAQLRKSAPFLQLACEDLHPWQEGRIVSWWEEGCYMLLLCLKVPFRVLSLFTHLQAFIKTAT